MTKVERLRQMVLAPTADSTDVPLQGLALMAESMERVDFQMLMCRRRLFAMQSMKRVDFPGTNKLS